MDPGAVTNIYKNGFIDIVLFDNKSSLIILNMEFLSVYLHINYER